MSTKRTFRIDTNINPDVKKGDKVKLTNDDTLTNFHLDGNYDLMRKYPDLGVDVPLGDAVGIVVETGVTNFGVERDSKFVTYLQDITVKIGEHFWRTTSGAVRVIRTPEEVVEKRIAEAQAEVAEAIRNEAYIGHIELLKNKVEFLTDLLNEIKTSK